MHGFKNRIGLAGHGFSLIRSIGSKIGWTGIGSVEPMVWPMNRPIPTEPDIQLIFFKKIYSTKTTPFWRIWKHLQPSFSICIDDEEVVAPNALWHRRQLPSMVSSAVTPLQPSPPLFFPLPPTAKPLLGIANPPPTVKASLWKTWLCALCTLRILIYIFYYYNIMFNIQFL